MRDRHGNDLLVMTMRTLGVDRDTAKDMLMGAAYGMSVETLARRVLFLSPRSGKKTALRALNEWRKTWQR